MYHVISCTWLLQSNRNGPTFFDIFMMILIDSDSIESSWSLYILNPHWLVFYDYLSFHSFWFHKLKKMISHSLSQLMGTLALIHLETNPISMIQIIYYRTIHYYYCRIPAVQKPKCVCAILIKWITSIWAASKWN